MGFSRKNFTPMMNFFQVEPLPWISSRFYRKHHPPPLDSTFSLYFPWKSTFLSSILVLNRGAMVFFSGKAQYLDGYFVVKVTNMLVKKSNLKIFSPHAFHYTVLS